jgi:hypothetical protein
MTTIKSHTDLSQSKKLAEFLPLESADMKWFSWKQESDSPLVPTFGYDKETAEFYKDTAAVYLPCWSLVALLSVLPDYTLQTNTDGTVFVVCDSKKPMISDSFSNPVDACVTMIEKLHELNLL